MLDLDLLVFNAGLRIKGDPALKIRVFKSCAEHFQGAYDAGQPVPQKVFDQFLLDRCIYRYGGSPNRFLRNLYDASPNGLICLKDNMVVLTVVCNVCTYEILVFR